MDKGRHSREVLKFLPAHFRSRIGEPERSGILRWQGDIEARDAVYRNRARAERVERSFAHSLDRGGMRRVWLRGDENIEKRYIIHVAGFNLGILMRALFGVGTPKGWAEETPSRVLLALFESRTGCFLVIAFAPGDRAFVALVVQIDLNL